MKSFVQLRFDGDWAVASVAGSDVAARFRVIDTPSLTERVADAVVSAHADSTDPLLVRFERASIAGRERLRAQRISWCGPGDELYLFASNLHVERQPRNARAGGNNLAGAKPANYFSKRSSRVVRWLLSHPHEQTMVRPLAAQLQLSEATVSRAVSALERGRFVQLVDNPADTREKRFRLREGDRLLERWAGAWELKRIETAAWDIGTWDVESTLEQFVRGAQLLDEQRSSPDERMHWCLGGLSGAAFTDKVVEPAAVFAWIDKTQLHRWQRHFQPTQRSRGVGAGLLTLAHADDPYLFELATTKVDAAANHLGLPVKVADPVQLFLDCRSAGERGLEAAEAIKATLDIADQTS
ncbi:MAG: hypothetical protein JHC87_10160, partial [Thermoleophilaceae bacterium]|nr:hypothetical protein [Thermoleophilaceae bacterium]